MLSLGAVVTSRGISRCRGCSTSTCGRHRYEQMDNKIIINSKSLFTLSLGVMVVAVVVAVACAA